MSSDDTAPAWTDPDDAPDLSAPEWQAKMNAAPVTRPRGRPPSDSPKGLTSLRLSAQVLDAFKATGPGWQTRIDAALWDAIDRHAADETAGAAARFKRALDGVIERRKRRG